MGTKVRERREGKGRKEQEDGREEEGRRRGYTKLKALARRNR